MSRLPAILEARRGAVGVIIITIILIICSIHIIVLILVPIHLTLIITAFGRHFHFFLGLPAAGCTAEQQPLRADESRAVLCTHMLSYTLSGTIGFAELSLWTKLLVRVEDLYQVITPDPMAYSCALPMAHSCNDLQLHAPIEIPPTTVGSQLHRPRPSGHGSTGWTPPSCGRSLGGGLRASRERSAGCRPPAGRRRWRS